MDAQKVPLIATHKSWAKSNIGWVTCHACGWNGHHSSLLCERISRKLYCPLCTSTSWTYAKREKVYE